MILVDVFVAGAPKTKGSMVVRNRATGAMKESVVGSAAWRILMAAAVRDDYRQRYDGFPVAVALPYCGPVKVAATFYLRGEGGGPATWERSGDVDKLARNLLDALGSNSDNPRKNGNVIVDDVQVVDLHVVKVANINAGVYIYVGTC